MNISFIFLTLDTSHFEISVLKEQATLNTVAQIKKREREREREREKKERKKETGLGTRK